MTDAKMKRVMVVLNGNHKLFPEQVDLLNDRFGPMSWGILTVPPDGWNLSEINDLVAMFKPPSCYDLVIASPIPALLVKLANSREDERPLLWAFHNDQRTSKEVPDGKGGVRLIKTVSPTGWKLIC